MSNQDDIDRLLRESAERWRSKPQPLPTIDEANFRKGFTAGSPTVMRLLSAVAGLAVLVVVAVVAFRTAVPDSARPGVALSTPTAEASATPSAVTASPSQLVTAPPSALNSTAPGTTDRPVPTVTGIVGEGAPVVAHGHLLESDSGVLLCQMLMGRATGTAPSCAFEPLVPVTGVDVRDLGAESGGVWVTDYVRVDGIWISGGVAANRVSPADRPQGAEHLQLLFPVDRDVPCETPPGGWPDPPEDDQLVAPLQAEIENHPEKYVGFWNGVVSDAKGDVLDLVVIVGTVADVAAVEAELRLLYPYNLCVTRAAYSGTDLRRIADSLSAIDPDWLVSISPSLSRVVVRLVVFDQASADALVPYADKVIVRPVVELNDD
jgi:hypothetical protein